MQLTKDFSLSEMTNSRKATASNIQNAPNDEQIANLRALCEQILQPARDKIGRAITVNSGFRSSALNVAVGGAASSQHLQGEAADITMSDKNSNMELFAIIRDLGNYDQLIDEKNFSWIHVSWKRAGNNRKQAFSKK